MPSDLKNSSAGISPGDTGRSFLLMSISVSDSPRSRCLRRRRKDIEEWLQDGEDRRIFLAQHPGEIHNALALDPHGHRAVGHQGEGDAVPGLEAQGVADFLGDGRSPLLVSVASVAMAHPCPLPTLRRGGLAGR